MKMFFPAHVLCSLSSVVKLKIEGQKLLACSRLSGSEDDRKRERQTRGGLSYETDGDAHRKF